MLAENVHYETITLEPGKFVYEGAGGPPIGYCADVFNGRAVVLRKTHPDADWDDIAQLGQHQRKVRLAVGASAKRLDSRRRKY